MNVVWIVKKKGIELGLDVGLSGCHVKWAVLKINKKKRKRGKIGKVQHAGEREREKGTVHKLGHLPEF